MKTLCENFRILLKVGPFVGSFTPNDRIPLNTGLCGAAATSGQVVVVQDVCKTRAIFLARG
jgi:putative methionine-R-sulfoxide reductase with GAF domain